MLQSKEKHGKGKKGKGGTEREEREGRDAKEGKETGRKVKRKEKKGTTAIWSDIVCNIGWKCYPALESGIFSVICSEKCMSSVDRVAAQSMDSRWDWGRTSVRQRSGHKLYAKLVGNATLR